MDDETAEVSPDSPSAEECCPPAADDAECCGPKRRSWVKTLVFVAVMAAAAGVGGYSLWRAHDSAAAGAGGAAAPPGCCDDPAACGDSGAGP